MKKALSVLLAMTFFVLSLSLFSCGEEPIPTDRIEPSSGITGQTGGSDDASASSGLSDTSGSFEDTRYSGDPTGTGSGGTGSAFVTASSSDSATQKEDTLSGLEKHPDYLDVNFGGKTFLFAVQAGWGGGWDTYEIDAEATGNDTLIDEAIVNRNTIVENLYNCKIQQTAAFDDRGQTIADDIATGKGLYSFCESLCGNAEFKSWSLNYHSLDIDLSHSWWDQRFIEAFDYTYKGKDYLYSLTGSFNLITYDSVIALFVNRDLYDQLRGTGKLKTDVFASVKSGDWTMDLMLETVNSVYTDTNGDSKMSYADGDVFGLVADANSMLSYALFYGADETTAHKDETGKIVAADANNHDLSRMSSAVDKAIALCHAPGTAIGIPENDGVEAVCNGQALFVPQYLIRLHNTDDLVTYGVDFGDTRISLVPFPKYSETQTEYKTYVSRRAYGLKVSAGIKDYAAVSAFLEVFGFHSQKLVYPAYVTYLKTSCLCDEEAGEMLELLLSTTVYDFCDFMEKTGYIGKIKYMIDNDKNTLSRAAASLAGTCNSVLDEQYETVSKFSH